LFGVCSVVSGFIFLVRKARSDLSAGLKQLTDVKQLLNRKKRVVYCFRLRYFVVFG
jgi:hypothetical protein